jgi:hypothetical protein
MKKLILFAAVALVVAAGTNAYAETRKVTTSGSLRFRGDLVDPLGFDSDNPGDDFVSTTTILRIDAEMTEGVSAHIELKEIDIWGSDMRIGFPGPGALDVHDLAEGAAAMSAVGAPVGLADEDGFSLYQGYVLVEDVADYEGLALKIGRQEIVAGTEWFFGNNDFGPGLSYDAISATYAQDDLQVLAFVAKLAEGRTGLLGPEDDADVDLYGIYSTYTGMDDMVVDAYFAFLRAADLIGVPQIPIPEAPDDMDDDPLELYTLGARVAGLYDAVDYNLEAAIQWGDNGWDGDYEGWALDAGVGYTFDYDCNPRVGLNYTFSSGDDDETDDNTETFLAPFADNYHRYGYMDLFGLGNMNVMKLSVTADATEKIGLGCHLLHLLAVEHEDGVAPAGPAGGALANADTIGTELDLVAKYSYSEDLSFELAYAYLWAGPYIKDVVSDDDDMQRLYLQAKLVF